MPDPYRESTEEKPETASASAPAAGSSVEQEILALEKELAVKKAALQKEAPPSLEQIIAQEAPKPAASAQSASPVAPAPAAAAVAPVQADAKRLKKLEKNQQLKSLVDLAFVKGVAHAVEVVKGLDNPYLMDEFHDVLIDELHKELVQKGKLEEV